MVSAACALALALLAFYGVFFSQTSQDVVRYLQSELALRNSRIATLEQTEQDLQRSILSSQSSLNGLSEQKAELEKQVANLKTAQESFSKQVQELGSMLAGTTFSLIREKISVALADGLSELAVIRIGIEVDWLAKGVRAREIRPWQSHLKSVEQAIAKLPEQDRLMGRSVYDKFVQQCSRYSSIVVQVPALRIDPNLDMSVYGNDRDKYPVAVRAKAVSKQIEKAEEDIQACFKSLNQ